MDPSISPLTQSIFSNLLDTQTRLRDEAERNRVQANKYLLDIAGQVASDWLAEKQNKGLDLNQISIEVLIAVIRERISILIRKENRIGDNPEVASPQRLLNFDEKYRIAESKIKQLEDEKNVLERTIKQLRIERKSPTDAASNPADDHPLDVSNLPPFFQTWQKEPVYDRQSFTLRFMGETGLARSPELKEKIESQFGMGKGSTAAVDVLKDLSSMGFINHFNPKGDGLKGRPPGIVELTPLGEIVYWLLTGKKSVPNEYSVKKIHKTDGHTRLNLIASDWLKQAGYEVIEHGPLIQLEGGHIFNPDMKAQKDGRVIFIEVERDSRKGNQDPEVKWKTFFHYTGGLIYCFCENERAQKELIKNINSALGTLVANARISICNLSKINSVFLKEKGDIWTSVREKGEIFAIYP